MMFIINQLNIKKEYASQFLREVNFFCPILHYKRMVIYQQLNIKYLKNSYLLQFRLCVISKEFGD